MKHFTWLQCWSPKLANVFNRIVNGLAVLSAAAIAFIAVAICYMVFMRFFFQVIPLWTNDITSFLLLMITFAGGAYVAEKDAHTRVDIVIRLIQGRPRIYLDFIVAMIVCLATAALTYFAYYSVIDHYERGTKIVRSIIVPTWIVILPILIGSAIVSLKYFQIALRIWHYGLFPRESPRGND